MTPIEKNQKFVTPGELPAQNFPEVNQGDLDNSTISEGREVVLGEKGNSENPALSEVHDQNGFLDAASQQALNDLGLKPADISMVAGAPADSREKLILSAIMDKKITTDNASDAADLQNLANGMGSQTK
jgi:hypothetical protein